LILIINQETDIKNKIDLKTDFKKNLKLHSYPILKTHFDFIHKLYEINYDDNAYKIYYKNKYNEFNDIYLKVYNNNFLFKSNDYIQHSNIFNITLDIFNDLNKNENNFKHKFYEIINKNFFFLEGINYENTNEIVDINKKSDINKEQINNTYIDLNKDIFVNIDILDTNKISLFKLKNNKILKNLLYLILASNNKYDLNDSNKFIKKLNSYNNNQIYFFNINIVILNNFLSKNENKNNEIFNMKNFNGNNEIDFIKYIQYVFDKISIFLLNINLIDLYN
jgi:hypothetical protein